MNNFCYYYMPTNNNKLFSILSVIETSAVGDKILVLTKKKEEVNELVNFFKTKGILSLGFSDEASFEAASNEAIDLYVTSEDLVDKVSGITVNFVVSLCASNTVEACQKKASLCSNQERQILIELMAKSDFVFIQSLYKFPDIEVNRFASIGEDIILKNKNDRVLKFVQYISNHTDYFPKTDLSVIEEVLRNIPFEVMQKICANLLALNVYAAFPKMAESILVPCFKGSKECKIELDKGYEAEITEEKLKAYFSQIEHFLPQYIIHMDISKDHTVVVLNVREISQEQVMQFLSENKFEESFLFGAKLLNFEYAKSEGEKSRKHEDAGSERSSYRRDSRDGRERYERREGESRDGERSDRRRSFDRREKPSYSPRREGGYSPRRYDNREKSSGYGDRENNNESNGGGFKRFGGGRDQQYSSGRKYSDGGKPWQSQDRDGRKRYGSSGSSSYRSSYNKEDAVSDHGSGFAFYEKDHGASKDGFNKDREGRYEKKRQFHKSDRFDRGDRGGDFQFRKDSDRPFRKSGDFSKFSKRSEKRMQYEGYEKAARSPEFDSELDKMTGE